MREVHFLDESASPAASTTTVMVAEMVEDDLV
jgi:hypothetical protein